MKKIHDIASVLRGFKVLQDVFLKDISCYNCKFDFECQNCKIIPDKRDVITNVVSFPRTFVNGISLVCFEISSLLKYKLNSDYSRNSDVDDKSSDMTKLEVMPIVNVSPITTRPSPESELDAVDKQLIEEFRKQHPEILYKSKEQSSTPNNFTNSKPANVEPSLKIEKKISNFGQERRVPSSEISRALSFGSLFARLGAGAIAESTRRKLSWNNPKEHQNVFLTEANAQRIVDSLCKVRGAALKLGQVFSIQDSEFMHPEIHGIFERVRQNADFMPVRQMRQVMRKELGENWMENFNEFDEKPFAAASIGQVHRAVLAQDINKVVAIKIQYPGVRRSIDSDVNNLMSMMQLVSFLPPGLHLDKALQVFKRELAWECDYKREAQFGMYFAKIFSNDSVFSVPKVIADLSTDQVLTTDYVDGVSLDKCVSLDQEIRDWIGYHMMRLCLKELFELRTMQTDPNWANFLFNLEKRKIYLIDFGASREYQKSFVDDYLKVIKYASLQDKEKILEYSRKLKFLTGFETQLMEQAHIDAVSILGEVFTSTEPFDFGRQSTTKRIKELIPVMLEHRLTSPPEETYSLHRKLSGGFLLCSKLKARVSCSKLFNELFDKYKFD